MTTVPLKSKNLRLRRTEISYLILGTSLLLVCTSKHGALFVGIDKNDILNMQSSNYFIDY